MATIHVTITSTEDAMRVVADMLNAGHRVTISLDEMGPTTPVEPMPRKAARAARPVVEFDSHDDLLQARQESYDQRVRDTILGMGVECPSCGVKRGESCVGPSGKPYKTFVHIDRYRNARMAGQ